MSIGRAWPSAKLAAQFTHRMPHADAFELNLRLAEEPALLVPVKAWHGAQDAGAAARIAAHRDVLDIWHICQLLVLSTLSLKRYARAIR